MSDELIPVASARPVPDTPLLRIRSDLPGPRERQEKYALRDKGRDR